MGGVGGVLFEKWELTILENMMVSVLHKEQEY